MNIVSLWCVSQSRSRTVVSGTYKTGAGVETNIQNFSHGMFQSVYDYPFLSSSANHIFDITVGIHTSSSLYSSVSVQKSKKNNVYNQMAQVLMGYNQDGVVQRFDEDGNIIAGGNKIDDALFINFARLLVKDEIKKGSFELELGVSQEYNRGNANFTERIKLTDAGADTSFKVNSPAGEYGILVAETTRDGDSVLTHPLIANETISGNTVTSTKPAVGLLFPSHDLWQIFELYRFRRGRL